MLGGARPGLDGHDRRVRGLKEAALHHYFPNVALAVSKTVKLEAGKVYQAPAGWHRGSKAEVTAIMGGGGDAAAAEEVLQGRASGMPTPGAEFRVGVRRFCFVFSDSVEDPEVPGFVFCYYYSIMKYRIMTRMTRRQFSKTRKPSPATRYRKFRLKFPQKFMVDHTKSLFTVGGRHRECVYTPEPMLKMEIASFVISSN